MELITDEMVNVAHALAEDRQLRRWFMGLEALSPPARVMAFNAMSEQMRAAGETSAMISAVSALGSAAFYAAVRERALELNDASRPSFYNVAMTLLLLAFMGFAGWALFFHPTPPSEYRVPTPHSFAPSRHHPPFTSRRAGDWPESLDELWKPLYATPLAIRAEQDPGISELIEASQHCRYFAGHAQPGVVIPDMVAYLAGHPSYYKFSICVAVMKLWTQKTVLQILMPYQYGSGGRHFQSLMPEVLREYETGQSRVADQLAADVVNNR